MPEGLPHVRSNVPPAAFSRYACPQCKGRLTAGNDTLHCFFCNRAYEVRDGIPDFLLADLSARNNPVFGKLKFIDRLAPVYESRIWYPLVLNFAAGFGRMSLPRLRRLVSELLLPVPGLLLNVACGPATYSRKIACGAAEVYGVDMSLGMLRQGAKYAAREAIANLNLARASVDALPFENGLFDGALCCGALHLFPDTGKALREIARTLKHSAPFVGVTFTPGSSGMLRFSGVRAHLRSHGLRAFEIPELGNYLSDAGFEDYRPVNDGSLLVFSVRRQGGGMVP